MSGIFDQIINYSPPLIVSGTVNYKGTWDASTNNPTLNSSPAASTKGDYYVVSTAGTQFGITFAIGDWIISNGTAWEKVDLTDAVSSVFGRTGAVVGVSTDYSAVGLTNTAIGASNPSTGAFTTVSASTPIAVASGGTGVSTSTGTTNVVLSNSPTIVTPVIAQINDASGNETLKLASIASAVNEISIENAATGNPVHIRATGGDVSVGLHLVAKGASGYVNVTDGVDETKRLIFNASGGTTNTRTMLSSTQTVDRTISLPDATGTLLYGGGPLGTPSSGTVTNLTGTASININGTVGATTASTGAFTTVNISNTNVGIAKWSGGDGLSFGGTNGTAFTINNSAGSTGAMSLTSTGLAVTGALSSTTGATFATSSGSVGIGTSSPRIRLEAVGTDSAESGTSTPNGGIMVSNPTASNSQVMTMGVVNGASNHSWIQSRNSTSANFYSLVLNPSGGNVGIGTASPGEKLTVYSATDTYATVRSASQVLAFNAGTGFIGSAATSIYNTSAIPMIFGTNNAERARIDSSGNLLVGTTGATPNGVGIAAGVVSINDGSRWAFHGATNATSERTIFAFSNPNGQVGSINTNGSATAYNTSSDVHLKTNIRDISDSGAIIDALQPRLFDWKTGGKDSYGFIAQEAHAVFPQAVSKGDDEFTNSLEYKQWAMDAGKFMPLVIAELKALRQRVAALEKSN
jgi:hypothetical protein